MVTLSFADRLGLLVDQEWSTMKSNYLYKLIKSAGLVEPGACVENIEYHSDRNLDKAQIARLATCTYIAEHHNILLLGATGSGKTYLACTMGMAPGGEIYPSTGVAGQARHSKNQQHVPKGDSSVYEILPY